MALLEDTALSIARVDDRAALLDPSLHDRAAPVHAVRLTDLSDPWSFLGVEDVVVRPSWVHWVCPAVEGSDGVLARQRSSERRLTRHASRELSELELEVTDPITPSALDEWSTLYHAQQHGQARSVDFLALNREQLGDGAHALMMWRRHGVAVAGVVVKRDVEVGAIMLRLGAVHPERGSRTLSRGMYLELADLARRDAMQWVTLGADVNFYGAIALPGLSVFKHRFGFRAVPADVLGLRRCRTVVERVVSLHDLQAPVILLEHTSRPAEPRSVNDFVGGAGALEFVSIVPDDDRRDDVLALLPKHRRLRLPVP